MSDKSEPAADHEDNTSSDACDCPDDAYPEHPLTDADWRAMARAHGLSNSDIAAMFGADEPGESALAVTTVVCGTPSNFPLPSLVLPMRTFDVSAMLAETLQHGPCNDHQKFADRARAASGD